MRQNGMELIERFLAYLTADRGYSFRTVNTYRLDLTDFRAFFVSLDDGLDWQTLDGDVVRRWVTTRMERGISPRTVKRSLSAIRSFYRYLMQMGLADVDPARCVRNPKADKPLPGFVKERDMNRLFDEMEFPDDFEGRRDRLILLTFYSTGIRVSELVGLNTDAVGTDTGELKVTGKRNKQRIVPFGAELADALAVYLREREAMVGDSRGAVFVRKDGKRMTDAEVRKVVKSYLSLVTTLKRRGPHALRHTFATVMLNNGAELEAVKELLGHENLATTEIYAHTTFAELKKEYEQAHPRA